MSCPAIGDPMIPSPMNPISMWSPRCLLLFDAVCRAPAEAVAGLAFRFVLAADPAVVADRVQESEQESIVDLAGAGFVAAWVVGELEVRDARQILLNGVGELAFHPLHVIDVVEH